MASSSPENKIPYSILFQNEPLFHVSPHIVGCTYFFHDVSLGWDKLYTRAINKRGIVATHQIQEVLHVCWCHLLWRNFLFLFFNARSEFCPVATYPSAGGRCVTRGMRVPRKEYARSRHQRLFEENIWKTGKDAIYELLSKRFGSCIYARGRY